MGTTKLLLMGSSGMAGHMIYHYFYENPAYQIIDVSHSIKVSKNTILMDIRNSGEVESLVRAESPDYIINCIGLLIKASKDNPDKAIYVNAYFPHQLESLATQVGAKLIHISTDCVFSGKKGDYIENDFKDGEGFYAQSKALGEIVNDKDLTIRTSIIGPEIKHNGEGLFDWFLKQQGSINGYANVFWSGVTTLELARAIEASIVQRISGLYHLTSKEKISKYALLQLFKEVWNRDNVDIVPYGDVKYDKSLINTRFDINFETRMYSTMLNDMRQFMLDHLQLYSHYLIPNVR